MTNNTYVAIMAGGVGSRFWPISRVSRPKQFLDILGTGKTLLQSTFERFASFVPDKNIFVITSCEYTSMVKEQLPEIQEQNILSEPQRKNTAPCIAYISFQLQRTDPGASLIVAPADHLVTNNISFEMVCKQALGFIGNNDALVTLGIRPSYPNTGYGYIRYNKQEVSGSVHKVETFTEKPDLETASSFIESGNYLWNAGIFIWKVKNIIRAFEVFAPELHTMFSTDQPLETIFSNCENISIDKAVMEKASNVYVIPSSFGWSDLGTWNSAYENLSKDKYANATAGTNVVLIESENCLINAPQHKLIVAQGLQHYIVVDTDDIMLICKKEKEQEIKEYVSLVRTQKGEQFI